MAKDTRFELRCTATEMALWKSVAANAGLSLADWIRSRLLSADTVPESPRAALVDEAAGQIEDRGGCLEATALKDDPPSKPVRSRVRKKAEPIASDIPEIPEFEELIASPPASSFPVEAPACAECGESPCICRALENVEPPSVQVAAVMLPTVTSFEEAAEACIDTCRHAEEVEVEPSAPGPPRHKFNRHPKCTTEKCERGLMGPACTLCRMANAISF